MARMVVPDLKTVREINRWVVENNIADLADFGGIKPEIATEWLQGLADHVQDFPELREAQKFTGSIQAQNKIWYDSKVSEIAEKIRERSTDISEEAGTAIAKRYVKRPGVPGAALARSWDNEELGGVAINRNWGKDTDVFKEALRSNVETGFHPVGCDTIKSVLDHEMGHQMDYLLGLRSDHEIVMLYKEARGKGIEKELSTYAGSNINEFVAEAWAEYRNNPKPRPMAQRLGEIVLDRYKKHSGRN